MKPAVALAALAGTLVYALDAPRKHHPRGFRPRLDDTLPGLDSTQTDHAVHIMSKGTGMRVGKPGCLAAISAALGETGIHVYANKNVPSSLGEIYDKDMVATAGDGLGLYMQSNAIYKDVHCSMHQTCASSKFYDALRKIKDWEKLPVGQVVYQVQGTHDAAYFETFVANATRICEGF